MRNKDELKAVLDYFQSGEDKDLQFDEDAIVTAYQGNTENQSLTIKIVSVFGGILASLAFLGFLLIAGLYDSGLGLLTFGTLCIAGAIWISKVYVKIVFDTLSVSSFIIGFILLGLGLDQFQLSENTVSLVFIFLALLSLRLVQNFILSFIAVLIINGGVLTLILSNNGYNFIQVYVSILALAITFLFLKEAKLITIHRVLNRLYSPIRIGLIFSFLSGLIILGKKGILPISPDYIWLSSIVILIMIIFSITYLFDLLCITSLTQKISVYALCLVLLLPTTLSPAISGAVLIMTLSFLVNHKTGLVIGIVSLIYFIFQYYYDLNFTLLTKSILLFSSGILFLGLYLFTYKNLNPNENV